MALFLIFLAIPLIEIGLFIQIGGLIGLVPTLALVVLAGILGVSVMRQQGLAAMTQMQSRLRQFRDPAEPLAHGALIMLAGVLLVVPGFFSDICGLVLLIPAVRSAIMARLHGRMSVQTSFRHRPDPGILDGEFYEVDPDAPQVPPPSDWTRR